MDLIANLISNPLTLKLVVIATLSLSYGFSLIVSILNLKHRRPRIESSLAEFIDENKYAQLLAYNKEKSRLALWEGLLSFAALLLFLLFDGPGQLDRMLASVIAHARLRALVFFGILSLASGLLSLPFSLYHDFSLEARYGFNTKTIGIYISDTIKGLILGAVFGGGLLYLLLICIDTFGSLFWLIFGLILFAVTFIISSLYTTLILPLFNKLSPLEAGDLKTAIEKLASQTRFPLSGVYVMNASKRSKKSNAFFSGLGRFKKIVLFDTLIANHPVDEITAILAHEIGHYKRHHIPYGNVLSALSIFITMALFSLLVGSRSLSLALGAADLQVHINLLAFFLLYEPLSLLMNIGTNIISRRFEYQADAYAVRAVSVESMGRALKRLFADNLSDLYPHPLYVFVNYSHPPLLARLKAIEALKTLDTQTLEAVKKEGGV
ncbi:M48 family metallopeptidase [Gracilinema caldarium]|uniref:Ste24 endopeptidase n=1 Tax=Gracilinema caldarium (strain ATCC 51460 / DSM 7334 / H1) TaxID=744872 RepID=F8EZP3_GRAC1|nr:M48 family metallopeptidase [Gracilinema caldarium]AEJ20767.1 Ste24 endopeptidase [Gracilinema caldarium DSM 7334]